MSGRLRTDSRFLETLFSAGTACGLSDYELLERFVARHDATAEAAFETLVLRHGSMVFGIGLKILGNTHDAQDAFQANERASRSSIKPTTKRCEALTLILCACANQFFENVTVLFDGASNALV